MDIVALAEQEIAAVYTKVESEEDRLGWVLRQVVKGPT